MEILLSQSRKNGMSAMYPTNDGFMLHVKVFYKATYHVIYIILEKNINKHIHLQGHAVAQLVEDYATSREGHGFISDGIIRVSLT
jgi:hypothetical protein